MSGAALAGQRVLLTGASRGIGRAIAELLSAEGAELALVVRDRASVGPLLQGAVGARSHAVIEANLAAPDEVERVVPEALAAFGGLDAFVSCAGIVEYAHVDVLAIDAAERQQRVNYLSPLQLALAAARALPASGSMVLVVSTLALAPAPLTAAYAASKAALVAAVRALALELAPRGVRVNAVAPGPIATDMLRVLRYAPGEPAVLGAQADARLAAQLASLARLHPLGRLGQPEDIAHTVRYLLTAPYVTGNILAVDGGLLLGSGEP